MSRALKKVIQQHGKSGLARMLTDYAKQSDEFAGVTISPELVHMWTLRGVPANRCRLVEQATGGLVTVHDLNPEVFGPKPVTVGGAHGR